MKTILTIITLALLTLTACTDRPPDVGRTVAALENDGGILIGCQGDCNGEWSWNGTDEIQLYPMAEIDCDPDHQLTGDGYMAKVKISCAVAGTYGMRECHVCCTTATRCSGTWPNRVCWEEVTCGPRQCPSGDRVFDPWPPP